MTGPPGLNPPASACHCHGDGDSCDPAASQAALAVAALSSGPQAEPPILTATRREGHRRDPGLGPAPARLCSGSTVTVPDSVGAGRRHGRGSTAEADARATARRAGRVRVRSYYRHWQPVTASHGTAPGRPGTLRVSSRQWGHSRPVSGLARGPDRLAAAGPRRPGSAGHTRLPDLRDSERSLENYASPGLLRIFKSRSMGTTHVVVSEPPSQENPATFVTQITHGSAVTDCRPVWACRKFKYLYIGCG